MRLMLSTSGLPVGMVKKKQVNSQVYFRPRAFATGLAMVGWPNIWAMNSSNAKTSNSINSYALSQRSNGIFALFAPTTVSPHFWTGAAPHCYMKQVDKLDENNWHVRLLGFLFTSNANPCKNPCKRSMMYNAKFSFHGSVCEILQQKQQKNTKEVKLFRGIILEDIQIVPFRGIIQRSQTIPPLILSLRGKLLVFVCFQNVPKSWDDGLLELFPQVMFLQHGCK